ncbi:MAG: hypothetical protein RLN60_05510 [Phycisphaerales bacterium]
MTTKDLIFPRRATRAALAAGLLAAALLVPGTGRPGEAMNSPSADSQQTEVAHTPLLPRQTRHIIKFHRWGLA